MCARVAIQARHNRTAACRQAPTAPSRALLTCAVCGTERDNLAAEVGSNASDYADSQYQQQGARYHRRARPPAAAARRLAGVPHTQTRRAALCR